MLPSLWPKKEHIASQMSDILALVMNKNAFEFGDTWWRQTAGTAMGTPC